MLIVCIGHLQLTRLGSEDAPNILVQPQAAGGLIPAQYPRMPKNSPTELPKSARQRQSPVAAVTKVELTLLCFEAFL